MPNYVPCADLATKLLRISPDDVTEYLWEHTCFPMGSPEQVSQDIRDEFARMVIWPDSKGCDLCKNPVWPETGDWTCGECRAVLEQCKEND